MEKDAETTTASFDKKLEELDRQIAILSDIRDNLISYRWFVENEGDAITLDDEYIARYFSRAES